MYWPEHAIDRLLGDHDSASLQANATTSADPEEDGIHRPSMAQQFDDLVEEDGEGGDTHPVRDGQDRTNLEHGVSETKKNLLYVI